MDWATLGAFLSGVGSVVSAGFYIRAMRRRADRECEKRLEAFREGIKMERER
jgi:hypothetical protein